MALALIPSGPTITATDRMRLIMAALVAPYVGLVTLDLNPAAEEV
jgi:hypothetical protein